MNNLKYMLVMLIGFGLIIAACESPRQQDLDPTVTDIRPDMPVESGDLIGKEVENRQGETLGRIDDIALDPQTGQVAYVLVTDGGILGVGGEERVVPPGALSIAYKPVERRNGETEMDARGDDIRTGDPMAAPATRSRMHGHDDAKIVMDITREQWEQTPTVDRDLLRERDAAEHRETYTQYQQQWPGDLDATRLVWAGDLRGMNVVMQDEESIGRIDEIIVDLDGGTAPFALVSMDEWLGTDTPAATQPGTGAQPGTQQPEAQREQQVGMQDRDARTHADATPGTQRERLMVPITLLQFDDEEDEVRLQADHTALQQARTITADEWERVRERPGNEVYVYTGLDIMYGRHLDEQDPDRDTEIQYNR